MGLVEVGAGEGAGMVVEVVWEGLFRNGVAEKSDFWRCLELVSGGPDEARVPEKVSKVEEGWTEPLTVQCGRGTWIV